MKNIYLVFCVLCSVIGFSQNYWEQYNNKPVKKVTYYNTNQNLDTLNKQKTTLYFYPNALLYKTVFGNPNFQQSRFYLYAADSLQQVITQFIESGEVKGYDLEQVVENHEKIYLKSAKVYRQHNFFTGETLGEVAVQNNVYDKHNFMRYSLKEKEPYNNSSYFELSENRYKKRNISSSLFKIFSVDQITNDTVVDYQNQSSYTVLDSNKIGPTAFQIISGQDTIYQKIVYDLFTKSELQNQAVKYTTLEDLLVFDIDQLIYEDISKDGFYLLVNHFHNLDFKDVKAEEKLPKWEQVFAQYIEKLLGNLELDAAFAACEALLEKPGAFQWESLFALNSVGYGITYDNGNWEKAKYFANQLRELQLEQDNTYGAKMQLATIAELEVRLNNKPKAQEILKELLEYKNELKRELPDLSDYNFSYVEMDFQIKYNDFTFQIANLYNLLGKKTEAIAILNSNLADILQLEQTGLLDDFYFESKDKNKALLEELNKQ